MRIFMSLINCNPGWSLIGCSSDHLTGSWAPIGWSDKAEFSVRRRLRSDLTLGILLKYPFCFDLSFDWNCPEKIAKHQNMPHQFLSNHWRYFDREDCFLTKQGYKSSNLQNNKERWIIRVINLHLISANPSKHYWESGRLVEARQPTYCVMCLLQDCFIILLGKSTIRATVKQFQ